jgi:DNA-binding transcriptional regulator PaaX
MSTDKKRQWLLLAYKIPPEPARNRVAIWRKLRGLGAVYIQNSACLLPAGAEHARQLKIVQNDITSSRGEAVLMEATGLDKAQVEWIVRKFNEDRNEEYREFLSKCKEFIAEVQHEISIKYFTYAELQENDHDVKKLRNWMAKIRQLDFYGAPLQAEAQNYLSKCETLLEQFAQSVFEAEHSPKPARKRKG